jgi:hypothetical protein
VSPKSGRGALAEPSLGGLKAGKTTTRAMFWCEVFGLSDTMSIEGLVAN